MKNSRAADLGSKAKNLLPLSLFVMVGMNASESVTFTFKIVTVLEKCIYRKGSQVQWTEDKESMIPLSISHPLPSFAGHLAPSFQCLLHQESLCMWHAAEGHPVFPHNPRRIAGHLNNTNHREKL